MIPARLPYVLFGSSDDSAPERSCFNSSHVCLQIGDLENYFLFEHNHVHKRSADPAHEHHEKLSSESKVSSSTFYFITLKFFILTRYDIIHDINISVSFFFFFERPVSHGKKILSLHLNDEFLSISKIVLILGFSWY